ncbi:TetR/AcrR family transcriptional regulator [Mycobacterium ulcerans]|uniref:TetR/AcrR family transcriptional regulator n=1 Tax=Mycobacterium ulcerans TaxID=1809 RepID=UPI001F068B2D|nr:TetR/AcrR family transcriptional regulator [Mycobacterium ulcerans]
MQLTASRGPGRPPAAKADDTRRRIVGAAREVFSERGYDGATFQAIAVSADLTRPAINHYFASKQALYREVVVQANELVVAAGVERARSVQTLLGQLCTFVMVAKEADASHPATTAFLATAVLESQRHPELRRSDHDAVAATREFLDTAVRDAIQRGELEAGVDASQLAEALLLLLCGVGFYAGFVGSYRDMENILDTLCKMMAGTLWKPRS